MSQPGRRHEQHIALREAHQVDREEVYFKARPQIDTMQSRRVFAAAFKAGYEARDHAAPQAVPLTQELWVVTYLHDWDEDGGIYPEVHSVHTSWQGAEKERATRMSPEKYYVRRARLLSACGITVKGEQP